MGRPDKGSLSVHTSAQTKDCPLGDLFLESVLIYSPRAVNENQDCSVRFDVAAENWSIFRGRTSNVRYYTTVYVQVWQSDSGLTLWTKEGTSK